MQFSPSFFLQLFFSLLIGGGVAYRLKKTLLAVLLRVMPMRYKISENASYLQARISTVLIFVIVFLVAGLSYYGIHQAKQALLSSMTYTQAVVASSPQSIPPASPPERSIPLPDTAVYEKVPVTYSENFEQLAPRPRYPIAPSPTPSPRYYLQIAAFRNPQKAIKKKEVENSIRNMQCLVGVVEVDNVPFKILLGPFLSLQNVKSFQRQRSLSGYPKSAEQIDYFLRP